MKWMRKVLPALILCLAACAGNNATSRVIKPDVNKVNDLAFLRQAGVNVDSIAAAEKAGQPLWLTRPQYEVLVKSLGTQASLPCTPWATTMPWCSTGRPTAPAAGC